MELLSYSSMSADEEKLIHSFLDDITVVELNISIRQVAIAFRKKYGLKLPDAIVGATAMTLGLPLLTNDLKLARLEEVEVIDCPLRTG
jgi:predicted nucleic acid-binding protein